MKQYHVLCSNENLDARNLRLLEWNSQKMIVEYAYNHSPFYRRFYDEKAFHPLMLKEKDDWNKVPVLEKDLVRKYCDEMISKEAKPSMMKDSTTGGSTGRPLRTYHDKRFHFEVLGWRSFRWWGLSPAASVGIVHRRVPKTFLQVLKNRILWWPTYRSYLDASSMDERDIRDFVKRIKENKVKWLQGYVGSLERVADYIIKNNIKIDTLKMVWATSAPIYKNVREKMERAFGCNIMNQYGCCEIYQIATQCPHSNHLHIHSDCVHVDVVDINNHLIKDQEGDILVTDLNNKVFPLIKYRLGDRGTLLSEKCSCGLPLPLMKEVKGRISDIVVCPSGLCVSGDYMTTIFDNYIDFIDQFQVIQKKDYNLFVKVKLKEPNNAKSYEILNTICVQLREKVKDEISVEILAVDHIDDDKGKIRYVISEVALTLDR